ncbi:MAG: N-acetyl-gamma-glutamyl-phosphate reductase [Bacteroidota bacterium]
MSIKAGIIGGAGYTAGELLRLLLWHPEVELDYVHSRSQADKAISDIHSDLLGETALHFSAEPHFEVEVLFLCLGHGHSKQFMEEYEVPKAVKVIDLSQDYRLANKAFVYGLPELNRPFLQKSNRIANCGCFATAIQLALLPLAAAGQLQNDIHIHAITGATGAGVRPAATTHFSWRNNNVSVYKAFRHQHLAEITQSLQQVQPDFQAQLHFVPIRGNFARGILASLYTDTQLSEKELMDCYTDYYQGEAFIQISPHNPHLKQVVNTNKCLIYPQWIEGKAHLISLIDNLLKGASGQAVQNMNIAFGFPETLGLQLKAMAY